MDKQTATKYVTIVIDNLEGGYYHPDMKSKLKGGEAMMDSGETMFGLDRKAGAPGVTVGASQEAFWRTIDTYYGKHHADTAYYADMAAGKKADIPATVGQTLKTYAADIILQLFNDYATRYKLDAAAAQKIFSNPALTLQFFYAVYNGPVAFGKFVEVMNAAYRKGTQDARALYQLLQAKRRTMGSGEYGNKLYRQGADKIDQIIKKYFGLDYADGAASSNGGNGAKWLLIALAAAGVVYFITKK